jgi:uncharacterized protein
MTESMTAHQLFIEGRSLVHGYSAKPNLTEGTRLLELAAAQDHAEALFELARLHIDGRHYERDVVRGTAMLEQADRLGANDDIRTALGTMYAQGVFGASDYTTAHDWLSKHAEGGDGEFECYLGRLAENTGDFAEAAKWYRLAKAHKYEDAMWRLADLLLEGKGVAPSVAEALSLLELASSEFDCAAAHYRLGEIYDEGKYVVQDRAKAAGNFYIAADVGHVLAQMRYGESAEAGFGDPTAPDDAYVWTRIALEHLPAAFKPRAEATLARIAATMTPEARALAENEAYESRFSYVLPLDLAVSIESRGMTL